MSVSETPSPPEAGDVAAVDLGSNSFHMLVAREDGGALRVLDRLREPVRLGGGLQADGTLDETVRARALDCLARFGQRLRGLTPQRVRAVGTNTLRQLEDGGAFVAAAEAALGHEIEVISGVEEARLVYGGVMQGLGPMPPRRLVVDIGGGSTELIIGRGGKPQLMESVSLGCVSHSRRFFGDGEITRARMRQARLAARVEMEFLQHRYRRHGGMWRSARLAPCAASGGW
jgi:Ppx/GppA phosphatase